MKRIVVCILTLIFVTCTMTGCVVIPLYEHFEIDADTVTCIEIYDLCEVDSLFGGFVKTEMPVYEIPLEKNTDFLNDLAKVRFSDTIIISLAAIDPSFYYDEWTIRINYTDGSYELISSDGYGETYDKNGEIIDSHHFGCDQEEWRSFIGKYVPEDIFYHTHETDSIDVGAFSYASDCEFYKDRADGCGVKRSGFNNTENTPISSADQAVSLAKNECTVEYDTIDVAFDSELKIYRISFSKKDWLGGNQDIYINQEGITLLIASGE